MFGIKVLNIGLILAVCLTLAACEDLYQGMVIPSPVPDTTLSSSPSPNPSPSLFINPAPVIGSVYPYAGPVSGNTTVTIAGNNFNSDSTVWFYPATSSSPYPCTISATSLPTSSTITCTTSAEPWGPNTVTVQNSDSQTGSLINGFRFVPPAPSLITYAPVTQCSPTISTWGTGSNVTVSPSTTPYSAIIETPLTLKGLNFLPGMTATVGGLPCVSPSPDLTQCPQTLQCTAQPLPVGYATIVITNPDGQAYTLVNGFYSQLPPPSNLSYSTNPALYPLGFPIQANIPIYTGGPPSAYQISPTPLPAGLNFDSSTGIISGTPYAVASPNIYKVSATNASNLSNPAVANIGISIVNLGNGADGNFTLSTPGTYSINKYAALVSSAVAGTQTITVDTAIDSSGNPLFNPGDLILIIQMQGPVKSSNWELANILSMSQSTTQYTLTLKSKLQNNYLAGGADSTSGASQIVRVPQYSNVNIPSTVTITPSPWTVSGTSPKIGKGGILAFVANGTVSISGTLNASGYGFTGGVGSASGAGSAGESSYSQSSIYLGGAGSGGPCGGVPECFLSGSGAGYGSPGIVGTTNGDPGTAGSAFGVSSLDNLFLGPGGGGSSDGTSTMPKRAIDTGSTGGGIILIFAQSISMLNSATIRADGNNSTTNGYGGGAGAGGSIYLKAQTINLNSKTVSAQGGNGIDNTRSGYGSGGNGRIRLDGNNITGITNVIPAPGYMGKP